MQNTVNPSGREKEIKVSVIVPVYKVEEYLEECLRSLVNQTLQQIEILVVNDGSPDNSQSIIDRFAEAYPEKIRSFQKANGGLSDARNYGIQQARGEYIGFVDSDDYVDPSFYELLYSQAARDGAQVACCGYITVHKETIVKKYYDSSVYGGSALSNPKLLIYANSIACNKIFMLDFWRENGFSFPVGQWFEDSAVIYNVMLAANKVSFVNRPLYYYRQTRGDAITQRFDPRIFDALKSAESIVSYYTQHNAFEAAKDTLELICIRHTTARLKLLPNCSNKPMARQYVREMFSFLNRCFPDWRSNPCLHPDNPSLKTRLSKFIQRNKPCLLFVVSMPGCFFRTAKKGLVLIGKTKARLTRSRRLSIENEKKRQGIQSIGISVLKDVQDILRDLDVQSFADFGTCLGLVREGHLLYHDLDMDIGVIAGREKMDEIHRSMEDKGYRIWRQYAWQDRIVEESYYFGDIKVDLNYYENTDRSARTWLFYRKPKYKYKNTWTRHVVEMNYSPISGIHFREFDGKQVALPNNPEQLLEEKYGPGWKHPDKKWIYWESPAATKLDEISSFITYKFEGLAFMPNADRTL